MEAGVVELQHRQPRQLADFWRQATSERVQVIAEAQASQAAQLSQEGRHRDIGLQARGMLSTLADAIDRAVGDASERLPPRGRRPPSGIQILEDIGGVCVGEQGIIDE